MINTFYIPHTIEECFVELDRLLSEKDKGFIRSFPDKQSTIRLHFSLGWIIRKRWRLWDNEPLLKYAAEKRGLLLAQPDEASREIIKAYYDYLWKGMKKNVTLH